jgi:hypothetical protein
MGTYNYRASEVPGVQSVLAPLYASASPPAPVVGTAVAVGTSAAGQDLPNLIDSDQVRGNLNGRFGGGCYAVWWGLELSDGGSGILNISVGAAGLDGPAEVKVATTLPLTDGVTNYVWISRGGVINAVTSVSDAPLLPPDAAAPWAHLGAVPVTGGVIQGIDYSGRLQQDQGNLALRRTADLAEPTDTPPSTVRFLTRTQGGLYLWDGAEYWALGSSTAATSAAVDDLSSDTDDLRELLGRLLARLTRSPLGPSLAGDDRLRLEILTAFAKGY